MGASVKNIKLSETNDKSKEKPLNQFLKLSNLGIQMGLIIGIGVFAGLKRIFILNSMQPLLLFFHYWGLRGFSTP